MQQNNKDLTVIDQPAFASGNYKTKEGNAGKIALLIISLILVFSAAGYWIGTFIWKRTATTVAVLPPPATAKVEKIHSENSVVFMRAGTTSTFSVFRILFDEQLSKHISLVRSPEGQKVKDFIRQMRSRSSSGGSQELFPRAGDFMAVTGAMFDQNDLLPPGLIITQGRILKRLNTGTGEGNFYEPEPNGVFFLNQEKTDIVETADFDVNARYDFALQSGPMLVQHGSINPSFPSNSPHKQFRCAVGIAREGSNTFLVFVSSESKVTFYDLALFMKKQDCQEALHLESMNAFMHFPGSTYAANEQLIRNYIVID